MWWLARKGTAKKRIYAWAKDNGTDLECVRNPWSQSNLFKLMCFFSSCFSPEIRVCRGRFDPSNGFYWHDIISVQILLFIEWAIYMLRLGKSIAMAPLYWFVLRFHAFIRRANMKCTKQPICSAVIWLVSNTKLAKKCVALISRSNGVFFHSRLDKFELLQSQPVNKHLHNFHSFWTTYVYIISFIFCTMDKIIKSVCEFIIPYLNIYLSDATQLSNLVQSNLQR